MRWPLKASKKNGEIVVISITEQQVRLLQIDRLEKRVLAFGEAAYSSMSQLETQVSDWCRQFSLKNKPCRWLLSRPLYQTYHAEKPEVAADEIDRALGWQLKDQLEIPLEEAILRHYQPGETENKGGQLVVVVVGKALVEKLIDLSKNLSLELDAIEIDELSLGHALQAEMTEDKIYGFIGEDHQGLVFNFYHNQQLTVTRYIRGKHFPAENTEELSLEIDDQAAQDAFLLEIQRTLDYCVNQIFRRPIDKLLLQAQADNSGPLAELVAQITEIPVTPVAVDLTRDESISGRPRLTEIGTALRAEA